MFLFGFYERTLGCVFREFYDRSWLDLFAVLLD